MARIRQEADDEVRLVCATSLRDMAGRGLVDAGRDLDVEPEHLWALLDGLTMHLLTESAPTTPAVAREVLRRHLRSLA